MRVAFRSLWGCDDALSPSIFQIWLAGLGEANLGERPVHTMPNSRLVADLPPHHRDIGSKAPSLLGGALMESAVMHSPLP